MGYRGLNLDMSDAGWQWQHQVELGSPLEADEGAVSLLHAGDAPVLRCSPLLDLWTDGQLLALQAMQLRCIRFMRLKMETCLFLCSGHVQTVPPAAH